MKCYICNVDLVPTQITYKGKKVDAWKCPECNDDLTTVVLPVDLGKALNNTN